jgi:hypothetical protein
MALTRLGLNQSINLATNTTGTLGVANGGTGLTSGTTDQFLKFTGSTTLASAADNAGKIGQVITQSQTASQSISSGSYTATTTGTAITPSATSSKIYVAISMQVQTYSSGGNSARGSLRVYRDIGGAGYSAVYPTADIINVGGTYDSSNPELSTFNRVNFLFLDSPNTTSAVNYKVYGKNSGGSNITISNSNGDSTINLFEVLA